MSRIRTLPRKRTVQQRSITVPKIRKKRKGFRAPLAKVKIKRKNPGGGANGSTQFGGAGWGVRRDYNEKNKSDNSVPHSSKVEFLSTASTIVPNLK